MSALLTRVKSGTRHTHLGTQRAYTHTHTSVKFQHTHTFYWLFMTLQLPSPSFSVLQTRLLRQRRISLTAERFVACCSSVRVDRRDRGETTSRPALIDRCENRVGYLFVHLRATLFFVGLIIRITGCEGVPIKPSQTQTAVRSARIQTICTRV